MKNDKRLVLLIVLAIMVFLWISVRPVWIRSTCYKESYQSRVNENNYEWAEGKGWHPTEIDGVSGPYKWIYFDQSSMYDSRDAKKEREQRQSKNYELCLLKKGLKN